MLQLQVFYLNIAYVYNKKHAYLHLLIFGSFYYLRLRLIVLPAFNYELVGSVSAFAHLWPWNR